MPLDYHVNDETVGSQQYSIHGLLGVMNILGFNYLLGITEKQYVGKIEGANVYQIKDVELFPFTSFSQQCRPYIDGIKRLLSQGFYFSYNYDLTSNRQRTA